MTENEQLARESELISLIGRDVNLSGERCPRCGYRTHMATFDGEIWYRCVTDECPRGWYEGSKTDGDGGESA